MVPDRGHDLCGFLIFHAAPEENIAGQQCAGAFVFVTTDHVPDVVEVARDGGELGQPFVNLERDEYRPRVLGDEPRVPGAMFGVAEHRKLAVGLSHEDDHFRVFDNVLEGQHVRLSYHAGGRGQSPTRRPEPE